MAKMRGSLVAGIAFLGWRGMLRYPPKNTEGSIGAAKRYQTSQISESDVELNDPQTQAFLQTDLFHRMQTDAEFRKAVLSGGLDRFVEAQARAIDISRAVRDVAKSADASKSAEIAARATDLAK